MTDQEIMTNYLLLLKSNVEVYVHGTLESSNKKVRDVIKLGLDKTLSAQECVFNKMVDYSFYEVNNTPSKDVKKVYDKICKNNEQN